SPRIETNGLAIPSCEADVGMLTNDFFKLYAIIFAISTDLPPPIPIIKSLLSFFISDTVLFADSTSLLVIRGHTYLIRESVRELEIFLSVIFRALSPDTKETFLGFDRPTKKLPIPEILFSPMSIFLGSSMM